ncbi:ferrous iron transport protein B [Endozoicomonas sp. GU-1]|uniref:ferrous iron transport protein B n=1 Tax=Endozoicomonas sp. GU-1 TaxID=3009078 RepID=UPI002FC3B5F9
MDGLGHWLNSVGAPAWAVTLLADGVGGGIQTVSTFIPVIAFLFLFLSILEDSGYMARAAFVIDRLMRFLGLPGKAFVPMLVGFGCNVPAIMAARTLDNEKDRLLTISMAPFMSCGARLPVYALFAAAFFPESGQNVVFILYLVGILAAIFTGLILKQSILSGDSSPFIMELPNYHLPSVTQVMLRTWDRLKAFILRAGKAIVMVVVVLNTLNAIGTDGSFGHQNTQNSLLSKIGQTITPIFSPMGMTEENWPAAVGLFTGILAKEAVVGTLDSMYGAIAASENADTEGETTFDLLAGLQEAVATIPANLSGLSGTLADPLGVEVGDLTDLEAVAEEQAVKVSTFFCYGRPVPQSCCGYCLLIDDPSLYSLRSSIGCYLPGNHPGLDAVHFRMDLLPWLCGCHYLLPVVTGICAARRNATLGGIDHADDVYCGYLDETHGSLSTARADGCQPAMTS